MPEDNLDFTEKYNTALAPAQERAFQDWTATQSKAVGRDISKDNYDYDMRGWFAKNGAVDLKGGHLTDEFKKPNHPTFSTQSQYHGAEGNEGGEWSKKADGSWRFTPGRTNLQNFSPDELNDYFKQVEPGNELQLPQKHASMLLDDRKNPHPGRVSGEGGGGSIRPKAPLPSDDEHAPTQEDRLRFKPLKPRTA